MSVKAKRLGRVDAYIQSTDKNLMVPVGGSIVAGFHQQFITDVSKTYPGQSPISCVCVCVGVCGCLCMRACVLACVSVYVCLCVYLLCTYT